MKIIFYSIIILFALYFTSCKERKNYANDKYETILIGFDDSKAIDIRDSTKYNIKEISLEITDNSLLTYIEQIELIDNKIFVYDKNRVMAFNIEGHFLYNIGRRGSGPGEYTNVNSFFHKKNNICVYDDNLQTLFVYEKDGNFIESIRTEERMSSIYPINDKRFVGRKKYQGASVLVPSLAILDENLVLVSNINNRHLVSGIGVFDYCYSYNDNILYWEFLNDMIYSVKDISILPFYYVDFQKFKIPTIERKDKEISEIIEYVNANSSKIATGIRYVQENQSDIRFIFTFKENIHYVKYDKINKKTSLYYFYDSKKEIVFQYFLKSANKNSKKEQSVENKIAATLCSLKNFT